MSISSSTVADSEPPPPPFGPRFYKIVNVNFRFFTKMGYTFCLIYMWAPIFKFLDPAQLQVHVYSTLCWTEFLCTLVIRICNERHGCITVALWFYISAFDHVTLQIPFCKKKLQFTAQIFLRTLRMYVSLFWIIVQANIFCHWNLDIY
jgi:hypothetical protein